MRFRKRSVKKKLTTIISSILTLSTVLPTMPAQRLRLELGNPAPANLRATLPRRKPPPSFLSPSQTSLTSTSPPPLHPTTHRYPPKLTPSPPKIQSFYTQIREIQAETGCRFSDYFLIENERATDYTKVWIETFQSLRRPCAGLGRGRGR